jgi:RNA polymerase-binding protein DksA
MNKRELARFKKLIQAERNRVLSNLGSIEAEISELSSNKSRSSQGYSNHMADIGSDAMGQEQVFLHASQETDYLKRLDEALRRIEAGTYGICEECSGKIPIKRLEAYPSAKLCIACQSKQERLQRS